MRGRAYMAAMEVFAALLLSSQLIAGTYKVCMFYNTEAPPSETVLVLEEPQAEGQELVGSFYGSPFLIGKVTANDGTPAFVSVTKDGTGEYYHSGRWRDDGVIEGQTLSRGRDFLIPWYASRSDAPCARPGA
ncbi:hypothetical protein HK107_13060 [Parvularcula sp. ZS-1/3]|uniref:Uncharacterized protein n=1 Tax=Parvularcula mediterranea TaxID=2732508 RepID=A0A7Y3RNE6_9PROT|nr:hypothetical protein [Parvularcula mediterranea]NNU17254.1 hypothetical protein [Parvularcula mediterranea]